MVQPSVAEVPEEASALYAKTPECLSSWLPSAAPACPPVPAESSRDQTDATASITTTHDEAPQMQCVVREQAPAADTPSRQVGAPSADNLAPACADTALSSPRDRASCGGRQQLEPLPELKDWRNAEAEHKPHLCCGGRAQPESPATDPSAFAQFQEELFRAATGFVQQVHEHQSRLS